MRTTHYHLTSRDPRVRFTAAIVADLHDRPYREILPILMREAPDIILIPGDLTEWLQGDPKIIHRPGLDFLREATKIAPTFYAPGNHEIGACHRHLRHADRIPAEQRTVSPAWRDIIAESGATFLDDTWVTWRNVTIGGIGSRLWAPHRRLDPEKIRDFVARPTAGYQLLLCHHPEYYPRYLRDTDVDLIVAGHAHGGQWRICGRGVFAPDQPIFPRYTSGVHDDRLVISRGVANTVSPIPRLFNPREVVVVTVGSVGSEGS